MKKLLVMGALVFALSSNAGDVLASDNQSGHGNMNHSEMKSMDKVTEAVPGLGNEPRPDGCRKPRGGERTFRMRIGRYRTVYEVVDDRLVVLIIRVRHRRDAYR